MTGIFEVVDERFEDFMSKTGQKRVRRLSVLDRSKPAFINTLDYEPKGADVNLLPEGTSLGKQITLGIRNLEVGFGGRVRVDAVLVAIEGKPVNVAEAVKAPVSK